MLDMDGQGTDEAAPKGTATDAHPDLDLEDALQSHSTPFTPALIAVMFAQITHNIKIHSFLC